MKKLKRTRELTGRPTHATKTDLKTGYAKKTKLFEDDNTVRSNLKSDIRHKNQGDIRQENKS